MSFKTFFFLTCVTIILDSVLSNHSFSDAREKFKDTLFVIKYNYNAPRELVLSHIHIWIKVFRNQMIFLPWTEKEASSFQAHNTSTLPKVNIVSYRDDIVDSGYLAYQVAVIAMKRFPNATGYLFSHDDVAMNVSRLIDLDDKSFWYSSWLPHRTDSCRDLDAGWKNQTNNWWWDSAYGTPAIDNLLGNHTDIATSMQRCFGSVHHWCGEQSDFFYVPQLFRSEFVRVVGAFGDHKIFLEVAIPSFYRCFVPPQKLEKVLTCSTFQEMRNNFTFMEDNCGENYPIFHPVKLSYPGNELGMRRKMGLRGAEKYRHNNKRTSIFASAKTFLNLFVGN